MGNSQTQILKKIIPVENVVSDRKLRDIKDDLFVLNKDFSIVRGKIYPIIFVNQVGDFFRSSNSSYDLIITFKNANKDKFTIDIQFDVENKTFEYENINIGMINSQSLDKIINEIVQKLNYS